MTLGTHAVERRQRIHETLMRPDVNVNVIRLEGWGWLGWLAARLMKTCVFNSVSTGLNVIRIL